MMQLAMRTLAGSVLRAFQPRKGRIFPAPFDHVFFINRDRDAHRLQALTARLRVLGVEAERFAPIPDSSPARSCALTHAAVVREARTRNLRNVLVLEDDVIFHSEMSDLWPRVAAQLAGIEYDLFYLYRWERPADEWPLEVVRVSGTLCSHCYAVHGRYFDRFIDLVESNLHRPVDLVLRDIREAAIYATSVNLAGQDAGVSLIDQQKKGIRWRSTD